MLEITTYPSPILKKKSRAVDEITEELRLLVSQMKEAMHRYEGIGLAAPQVGIPRQIFLVGDDEHLEEEAQRGGAEAAVFFNPEITSQSKERKTEEEGCLSLPGLFLPIRRSTSLKVRCMTLEGKLVDIEAEGLAARIFQHEIDHLKGKLIIDRISPIRRLKIRAQLREIARTGKTASQ